MSKGPRIAVAASLDLAAVVLAYLLAVFFRVGGRLETADPEGALLTAALAGLAHVFGNALIGAYRRTWPEEGRTLVLLTLPAIAVAGLVAALNSAMDTHAIPNGAIAPAAALAIVLEIVVHVRPRWGTIVRAIGGRRTTLPEGLPTIVELPKLDQLVLSPNATLRSAIAVIDRHVARIALISDPDRTLRGVVTDGDIRRALLAGLDLDAQISGAMTRSPVVAPPDVADDEVVELMRRHMVRQIPLVDDFGRVTDIRILDLLYKEQPDLCPVLIMAGGLGTRLGELTRTTPKPLMRVGGRPILDLLIEDLAAQGFRRVLVAVNYKADAIEEHIGDGSRFGLDVSYIRESEPRGTAGAIRLAEAYLTQPEFIVTNADLLTRVNFKELLSFHRREEHHLTVGVIESTLQLRYGLVETKGTRVVAIREKPALKHFINAGIYVIDRELSSLVPGEGRFDMDALIDAALKRHIVGCFPIHEYWTDIGEPDDLRRASKELRAQPNRRVLE